MKFDDLDKAMRIYETSHDHCVLPNVFMVARIDGRSFTKLTKETIGFDAPFDVRFRDLMIETTKHLMDCGFKVIYGYTESDEISLLFDPQINVFGRKTRKYNSILAGEASAKFSLLLGHLAAFDCRISQLPTKRLVIDYFRWRNEDAHRNALNAHCYWMLRKENVDANGAAAQISRKSTEEKNELLFSRGINFNELPNWQKRGAGLYWTTEEKGGFDPHKNIEVVSTRRAIKCDLELPMRDEYSKFVSAMLDRHGM